MVLQERSFDQVTPYAPTLKNDEAMTDQLYFSFRFQKFTPFPTNMVLHIDIHRIQQPPYIGTDDHTQFVGAL